MAQPQNIFYPAAPAAPTQNVTDFDMTAATLARRRRLAQLLQEQAITKGLDLPNPQARASWTNVLAPMANALVGKLEEERINEEEKKAGVEREKAAAPLAEDFFSKLRTQVIPGQEATPMIPSMEMGPPSPSGAMSQQPEQPAQPAIPEKMIPPDLIGALQAGNAYARVGGPAAQKMVDAMIPHLTKEILPSETPTEGGIWDRPGGGAKGSWRQGENAMSPATKVKYAEIAESRLARAEAAADALAEKARATDLNDATKRQLSAQAEATRLTLQQMRNDAAQARSDATAAQNKLFPTQDLDAETGHPVYRDPQGNLSVVGAGAPKPLTGETISRSAVEKEVPQIVSLNRGIAAGERGLALVKANPDAFGITSRVGDIPLAGQVIRKEVFTQKEIDAQTAIGREAAAMYKEMYGVAVSRGEQGIASRWIPSDKDPPEVTLSKIREMMEYGQAKKGFYSSTARLVADRRAGTPPPATPSSSGGKQVSVDY